MCEQALIFVSTGIKGIPRIELLPPTDGGFHPIYKDFRLLVDPNKVSDVEGSEGESDNSG